jgi:hypothetical protein
MKIPHHDPASHTIPAIFLIMADRARTHKGGGHAGSPIGRRLKVNAAAHGPEAHQAADGCEYDGL